MIGSADVMPLLLAACPSFLPVWRRYLEEWPEGELAMYPSLGSLASHVDGLLASGQTAEIGPVLQVVERLLVDGEAAVIAAMVHGFLEDLQNVVINKRGRDALEDYLPFLGPRSLVEWMGIIARWDMGPW